MSKIIKFRLSSVQHPWALAFLSLSFLASCLTTDPVVVFQPPPSFQTQANYHGDMAVKFNNAYQDLYTKNEAAGHADPQNPDKLFAKIMNEAKKTLDIAVFDIEEESACQSLIQARKRGVRVRIVTDADNLGEHGNPSKPRQVLALMKKAGIQIRADNRNAFMHHKFAIMDQHTVITGSLNLTNNSMYRDNNNSLKITSPELAALYQEEFNRLFVKGEFGPRPVSPPPAKPFKVDGGQLSVYFSPKGGAKEAVIRELSKAKNNIRFMVFSLTDDDIQHLLLQKFKAGVKIEGIFDGCMISQYSIFHDLITKNIPVLVDGNQALLHSKVFIIDGKTVITGSYNFSKNAELRNNENTLIIYSPKVTSFYQQEFERLKKAALTHKNLPPYDNRACSGRDSGSGNDTDLPEDT